VEETRCIKASDGKDDGSDEMLMTTMGMMVVDRRSDDKKWNSNIIYIPIYPICTPYIPYIYIPIVVRYIPIMEFPNMSMLHFNETTYP
jgi:hypothetical protein